MRARERVNRALRRAALAPVAAAYAAAIACSSGCAPTLADQRARHAEALAKQEACYAKANARKGLAADARCKGYFWDECPEREAIRAEHREEMRQCRP